MRMSTIAACWLLIAPVLFAAETSSAADLYAQALAQFRAQRYDDCLESLDLALGVKADYLPALTLKARLGMAVGRLEIAEEALRQALSYDADSAEAQFLYGFQFHLQNEMQRALVELEKARRLVPSDARPVLYLALTEESLGNIEKALALFREGIRLQEAAGKVEPEALLGYARLLFVQGEIAQSESLVRRAASLEPGSRDPQFELARILLHKGDAKAAIAAAETALARPATGITDWQIHYLLVRAYGIAGRPDLAAKHAAAMRAARSSGQHQSSSSKLYR